MTQEHKSTRNKPLSGFHRSIPAQGLCWLGSFSLLSSGFVYAQSESAIDNIVPTTENVQPVQKIPTSSLKVERVKKATPEASNSQAEFSSRRARLRDRLNRNSATANQKPVVRLQQRLANQAPKKPKNTAQSVIPTLRSRTRVVSPTATGTAENRSGLANNAAKPQSEVNTEAKQPQSTRTSQNAQIQPSRETVRDYNSAYLDPTEYKLKPTTASDAPTAVIVRSRSGECRVVGASSGVCAQVPVISSRNSSQNTDDAEKNAANAPNWMRKSENVRVVSAISNSRKITQPQTNTPSPHHRSARSQRTSTPIATSLARTEQPVSKNSFNPNRFIPAPSSFIPHQVPQTTVSSIPIAPKGGVLPIPINANFTAPRDSIVAYNIPLESTLPQISYGGMMGTFAANPTGIIFPLSVPAPITSLFGWRTHPITGDRRFHAGTDIGAAIGTPILASSTGQVEIADYIGGYGLTVILNHNNALQTLYGHMSQIYVQPGQWVEQGTVIGLVGNTGNSTGPHLHFEVRQLTPNGWVAVDAGVQLQYALQQMTQMLRTAQVEPTQRVSE